MISKSLECVKKRALLVWFTDCVWAWTACMWFSVCRCSVGWVEIDWLQKLVHTFQSQISKHGEKMASLSNSYWQDVKCINGKKIFCLSRKYEHAKEGFQKKKIRDIMCHTLKYFLGFQNWFYTGRNQSCHVKLTMIWSHFHGAAAYVSVITPEQTVILALYRSHTVVLFNPVCGKSLQGKWVAEMDVRQKVD